MFNVAHIKMLALNKVFTSNIYVVQLLTMHYFDSYYDRHRALCQEKSEKLVGWHCQSISQFSLITFALQDIIYQKNIMYSVY